MRQIITLLAGLILTMQSFAQFRITGTVSDEAGKPLGGANVYIEKTFMGTVSDNSGYYVLEKITPGLKVLRVTFVGYETEIREIDLKEDVHLNFNLRPALQMGEEAIIRAVRAGEKDPVAFSMISKEEIRKKNFGQDIPYILSLSPSVVATSDAGTGIGYTNFRIRGTDANRINITVNGIPLNDAESHGVWFVDLPDFAGSVENIQIQRGVGTSTNGASAFGASLNFQTQGINKKAYFETNHAYGSFNTMKNSASFGTGMLNDQFTFDSRISWIHSDGYIDRASSDLNSWYLSGARVKTRSLLKLIVFSGKEKTYQSWDGVPGYLLDSLRTYNGMGMYTDESGQIRFYDNETDNYLQTHSQLHYTLKLSESSSLTAAIHFTRGRGYYEQYKEDQDIVDYIPDIILHADTFAITDLIRRKWLDNYFYGGIFSYRITNDRLSAVLGGGLNQYDGHHFGTLVWARYAGNSEIDHEWYRNKGLKTDYNSFAKMNYSLSNSLNIYADLQFRGIHYKIEGFDDDRRDISQDHAFFFFNPKIGLNYMINDNHRGFLSFSVANREPNRDNFVDADPGKPYPVHETLYDYEMGYQFRVGKTQTGMNLYFMNYDNQLVLTGEINDVGAPVMINVKDSYRAGIEFTLKSEIFRSLVWDMNFCLSTNKIRNFKTFVDNWDYWDDPENEPFQYQYDLGTTDIAFSPGITAGNSFLFTPIENLSIDLHSKFTGKQFIDNTGSSERQLDPWLVHDLRMEYIMKTKKVDQVSFKIMIVNLFNEKYESNAWVYRYIYNGAESKYDGFFPQAGFHLLAGVTFRF